MFVTVGEKLFGLVDQVPGQFYIATRFFHICDFPLVPLRSYLVAEGSQVDPTLFRAGTFSGRPIGWMMKSIFVAWLRGVLGLLALVAVIVTFFALLLYFNDPAEYGNAQTLYVGLASAAILPIAGGIHLFSKRLTAASQGRLASLTQRWEKKYPEAFAIVAEQVRNDAGDVATVA